MAGNFWQSSHYQQWLLEAEELAAQRAPDVKALGGNEEDYERILIFYSNLVQQVGEQLKVRQQVIATATVFLRRYYARNSLGSIDPALLGPTALFLASKVEEYGLISASKLINSVHSILKNKAAQLGLYPSQPGAPKLLDFPYNTKQLQEVEFLLLEQMDCCLIVYHPYRPLVELVGDASEGAGGKEEKELLSLSWRIVNDSLRTDVGLLFPPYQIAIAALHIAAVILNRDLKNWFAELAVDMEQVKDVSRHLFALYNLWKNTDERTDLPQLLAKLPRPLTAEARSESH